MQLLQRILPIVASLLYVISPIDVLPDFLLPGVGWLDDLLVVGFLLWYMSRQPQGRSPWNVFRERMQGRGAPPPGAPRPEDLAADFDRMDPYALLGVSLAALVMIVRASANLPCWARIIPRATLISSLFPFLSFSSAAATTFSASEIFPFNR